MTATSTRDEVEAHEPVDHLSRLESPLTTYYLLLGATVTLVVYGLIMVFSASSVEALIDGGSAWGPFAKQAAFAVVGAIAAYLASRLPLVAIRRLALPVLAGSIVLLMLVFVPSIGYGSGGNRNWIAFGPVSLQPSEFAKLALALVGALVFSNKGRLVGYLRHVIIPYLVPVAAVILALVLGGHDLGTALVMVALIGTVLAVAGMPGRYFALAAGVGAVGVLGLVLTSSNRMDRITNFFSAECNSDPNGACGQYVHGMFSLAGGGWWGVGLGASKEKWLWLSEAENDFIFAIIGEELGLPGTLLVLLLFAALGWACYRLISRTREPFVRIATAGIMAWICFQAIINIGSVIGLVPVIGVPLPFMSAGGSSLIATLLAMGVLLSFARHEPGAAALLRGRPSLVSRSRAVFVSRRSTQPTKASTRSR